MESIKGQNRENAARLEIASLRRWLGQRLVKLAAGWISTNYHLWCLVDQGLAPKWIEKACIKISRQPVKRVVKAASWIDREAATDQMIEEG